MSLGRSLTTSLVLSGIGLLIGIYLIWVHYNIDALVCGTGDCEVVQTSSYATVMDIPIAWFGAAMYLAMLILSLGRSFRRSTVLPLSMLALAIAGAGTLYSAWLTWIEIYEIEAICQWCVASAIITTSLFVIELLIFRKLWSAEDDGEVEA